MKNIENGAEVICQQNAVQYLNIWYPYSTNQKLKYDTIVSKVSFTYVVFRLIQVYLLENFIYYSSF